ncbi:sugar phosphate nucleotidyltransferase [Silvibacterium dinghuense]|uniref:sugar phosphate nucleotidyltransferase n=1 Tax=Silvibacterium dinghuense TaxID=1560006 RepID=UPI0013E91A4E|nr:sugar phosphate nucleotidyltransferase [Silvibacterium dinghuense]GGG93171.1 glucose-1-phosphate cytidylyltransferase [Silvibacterium dinghuense]
MNASQKAVPGDLSVVILCGGKGSRIYPFSEYFPKPMMPIHGRPVLVHLMHVYAAQGVRHFVLAAGHRKEMLYDYFDGRFPEWKIDIVDTGLEADTGERIRSCFDRVGDKFFATYGDGLGNVDLHALLRFHEEKGGLATVTSVPLRSQYGTVHFNAGQQVDRFAEKPVIHDYWINAGFFVFEKAAAEFWQGTNLESDVLPRLAAERQLYTYLHHGFWKSMDTSKDQQELERLVGEGMAPWIAPAAN